MWDKKFHDSFQRDTLCAIYFFSSTVSVWLLDLLLRHTAGQRLHLLLEQLLGALPDRRAVAVLQAQEAGQQRVAEGL